MVRTLRRWRRLARHAATALRAGLVGRGATRGEDASLGRAGEDVAAAFLREKGYSILARNARAPMGEVDILCRDGAKRVVIVEVKTRARRDDAPAQSMGVAPEASITMHKRRKLLALARYLRSANKWPNPVRIDVIAVEWREGSREPTIRHHVDAVRG
jgi:putative endonuclease